MNFPYLQYKCLIIYLFKKVVMQNIHFMYYVEGEREKEIQYKVYLEVSHFKIINCVDRLRLTLSRIAPIKKCVIICPYFKLKELQATSDIFTNSSVFYKVILFPEGNSKLVKEEEQNVFATAEDLLELYEVVKKVTGIVSQDLKQEIKSRQIVKEFQHAQNQSKNSKNQRDLNQIQSQQISTIYSDPLNYEQYHKLKEENILTKQEIIKISQFNKEQNYHKNQSIHPSNQNQNVSEQNLMRISQNSIYFQDFRIVSKINHKKNKLLPSSSCRSIIKEHKLITLAQIIHQMGFFKEEEHPNNYCENNQQPIVLFSAKNKGFDKIIKGKFNDRIKEINKFKKNDNVQKDAFEQFQQRDSFQEQHKKITQQILNKKQQIKQYKQNYYRGKRMYTKINFIWIDPSNKEKKEQHAQITEQIKNCYKPSPKFHMFTKMEPNVIRLLDANPDTLFVMIYSNKPSDQIYQNHSYPFANVEQYIVYCGYKQKAEENLVTYGIMQDVEIFVSLKKVTSFIHEKMKEWITKLNLQIQIKPQ